MLLGLDEEGFDGLDHVGRVVLVVDLVEERDAPETVLADAMGGFSGGLLEAGEDIVPLAELSFPTPVEKLFQH